MIDNAFLSLERSGCSTSNQQPRKDNVSAGRGQLNIPDESSLSRYVAARLDLPVSQRLLNLSFKLSIIKRCWEDQLRFKRKYKLLYLIIKKGNISFVSILDDDFVDDCDLLVAAIILQKQIEYIDGKKENIITPSVAINKLREKAEEGIYSTVFT